MGHRLATTSDSLLERTAGDPRISDAARRVARRELERRERVESHCAKGAGCDDWQCPANHG